jgi:hypothetical protein
MAIMIHPHAKERMEERGATENEVRTTIIKGEKFPAKEQLIKEKKISFTDESTGKAFEVPLKF